MNAGKKSCGFSSRISGLGGLLLVGLLMAGAITWYAGGAIGTARAAAAPKSAEDGVYTAAQAAQGKTAYSESCSGCHMEDLSGSGQAPPLVGDSFGQYWDGRTVFDLYDLTQTSMPQDKPGSLTPDAYLGIVAFMLQSNSYPAGTEPLKNDPDALKNILIGKKTATK
ncbi:MAG: cytochrome c [Acidobacteriia bacterium]|nr:cytochrome c [Terriglobia bacterium]